MEERTEGFEIVRNTKTDVGLDAWRRLNHKYDPRKPASTHTVAGKAAFKTAGWLRRRGRKYGETRARITSCRNRYTWCASRSVLRSSEIILLCRLHPLTPLEFLQAKWMLTPLPRPREARRAEKGRTRSPKARSSMVTVSGAVHTAMR